MWLERTPGLEESGFNFPAKYKAAVHKLLQEETEMIQVIIANSLFCMKLLYDNDDKKG